MTSQKPFSVQISGGKTFCRFVIDFLIVIVKKKKKNQCKESEWGFMKSNLPQGREPPVNGHSMTGWVSARRLLKIITPDIIVLLLRTHS